MAQEEIRVEDIVGEDISERFDGMIGDLCELLVGLAASTRPTAPLREWFTLQQLAEAPFVTRSRRLNVRTIRADRPCHC
ncbi:MAG: hypothetical protein GWM88_09470 [Pseudomonadales bacterium]|nr:hypothetical protein [Pseudomonadales bacterium]NIX08221.1 hypothetical protein [Pseudomonadales bacterium]